MFLLKLSSMCVCVTNVSLCSLCLSEKPVTEKMSLELPGNFLWVQHRCHLCCGRWTLFKQEAGDRECFILLFVPQVTWWIKCWRTWVILWALWLWRVKYMTICSHYLRQHKTSDHKDFEQREPPPPLWWCRDVDLSLDNHPPPKMQPIRKFWGLDSKLWMSNNWKEFSIYSAETMWRMKTWRSI